MNNILTISNITMREAISKKIIVTFFAISTFVIIVFGLLFTFVATDSFLSGNMVNKNALNASAELVKGLKLFIVAPLFGGGLFLSIFSASSFIPNMLEKGNIDLLISKPISRPQIILGKFLGGVMIVLLNIAYLILSIWILIGFKFAVWDPSLLFSILTITFTFASLYALIIFIGILTQSSVLAMMLTYLIFFILSPILSARGTIGVLISNDILKTVLDVFYYIIPKTSELGSLTTELALGYGISECQPILTSLAFLILVLFSSIIIFSKKDY